MNRLTVISKNINKREINMVVVHSFDDAYKEAQDEMERGCDEVVVEDEVHNVVLRLIKPKKTNFDRITASPEALAELMNDCAGCNDCPITEKSVCKYNYESCKEAWLAWLKQESKE